MGTYPARYPAGIRNHTYTLYDLASHDWIHIFLFIAMMQPNTIEPCTHKHPKIDFDSLDERRESFDSLDHEQREGSAEDSDSLSDSEQGEDFDSLDEQREERHRVMTAARMLASRAPLKAGFQCELLLSVPPQSPDALSRTLPFIPPTNKPVLVELVETLQIDPSDSLSRVWTAKIVAAPQTVLVLKIIQPSQCPIPDPDETWRYYRDPSRVAPNEECAYNNLKSLQGLTIPYFFGRNTIITPSGEKADVLVLEYIPGPSLEVVLEAGFTQEMYDSVTQGMYAIENLTKAGLCHGGSICASNFVLLTSPTGVRSFVIVDLYNMYEVEDTAIMMDIGQQIGRFFYLFSFTLEDEDFVAFHEWAEGLPPRFHEALSTRNLVKKKTK
ncbi:hypothetical protein B0H15DRAFT_833007 [Mycena belliarum]|uniref:Protein kinase domain-containing protein n=1 Tax=Mycena belliarum TaxID=1033014 RepID=A0AAD6U6P4_9AGAR|nr:hypothetical protein B0H15DRAFT_833007 [Mycena belliae]